MTEQTRSRKLVVFLFFSFIVAVFGFFTYAFVTNKYSDPRWQRLRAVPTSKPVAPPKNGPYPLYIDKEQTVGNLKITYRGLESKTLLLDLVILELDQDYAYRRRIPINEAKSGFRLSDQPFYTQYIGPTKIDLARITDMPPN